MYYDIEPECYKAEELGERAGEMMFDINEKICKLGEIPAKNAEILDSALLDIGALEGKLDALKRQLAYMRDCEREFLREANAEPSGMEIYKARRNA